ncbi:MAG: hypothetical protein H6626_06450 [Pseudobdellovibrionaceae bacterium]|nr:hypothetical protein [Bdellovibrionales bacterium]USN48726.1 MAG: hypothetical protein H6626_06450 [Pseudobdellovibrionaceae bacterium]
MHLANRVVAGVIIFFCGLPALASVNSLWPDYYSNGMTLNTVQLGLQSLCSVFPVKNSAMPCNPAMLTVAPQSFSEANIYVGNAYDEVKKIRDLLKEEKSLDFIETLFDQGELLRAQGGIGLAFRSKHFAGAFVPYHVTYHSQLRNPYHPILSVHAMQERSLSGQVGGAFDRDFFWGVQLRYVHREFVDDEFSLYDELASSETILNVKKQQALYFEPGIVYKLSEGWDSYFSALMTNWGTADKDYDEVSFSPQFDLGFSVVPPLELGQLSLGVVFRANRDSKTLNEMWRLGGTYELGLMGAQWGWSDRDLSLGVTTSFDKLKVGLLYKREKWEKFGGFKLEDDALYSEFALVF